MKKTTASLIILALFACARASVAAEADRTEAFVKHSVMLTDHVVSKYRVRLRIGAVLGACGQDDLSKRVRLSPEAQVAEFRAYILANDEAASLGEQLLASLRIGIAYYMNGVVDTSRAYVLAEPIRKDSFCESAADAAKLLQAP
jgi:hypothetical protein